MHFQDVSSKIIDMIFNEIPIFVIAFNNEGNILFYNKTAEEVCGRHIHELKFDDIFFQDHRMPFDTEKKLRYECWISGRCYAIIDFYAEYSDGTLARYFCGNDITDVKNYILSYNNQSMVDPMTGIFNRQVGINFLNEMINKVRLDGDCFSVSYIDLDKLKNVNDNFGHNKGDEYIFAVCEAVKSSIRKTDVFSRIGGDEFLIIFPQCSADTARTIMDKVVSKLDKLNESLPKGIMYRISYGVLEVNSLSQLSAECVLNTADSKMYLMKADNNEKDRLAAANKSE